MKTILNDRTLWYDGDISFTPNQLCDYILSGGVLNPEIHHITKINDEVEKLGKFSGINLSIKEKLKDFDTSWNIPEDYKKLDINKYCYKKLLEECETSDFDRTEIDKRISRVKTELKLFDKYNMIQVVRTIIYVLNTFERNNIVWGTGRGSSCCSYVLYLIGLHDVDSIKYDLELNEFFR